MSVWNVLSRPGSRRLFSHRRFSRGLFSRVLCGVVGGVSCTLVLGVGVAGASTAAVTLPARNVTVSTVELCGSVNPQSLTLPASYQFDYGTTTGYGSLAPLSPVSIGTGETPEEVCEKVEGLNPGETVHYQIVGSDSEGEEPGGEQTVTTLPVLARIDGQSVSLVEQSSAIITALIDPQNTQTTYQIEYGTSTEYGSSFPVPGGTVGSGLSDIPVEEQVTGLQAGRTYHYRILATNAAGSVGGPDGTFTTAPPTPPVMGAYTASEVSQNGVTLSGTVDPQGTQTFYEFDLGTDTSYGTKIFGNAGFGNVPASVSVSLQNLAANTTYHYRLITTNTFATITGPDQTFTTPPYPTAILAAPPTTLLIPVPTTTFPDETLATSTNTKPKGRTTTKKKKQKRREGKKVRSGKARKADLAHTAALIGTVNAGGPAGLEDLPASGVSQFSATLQAILDPGLIPASYHFEYGTTSAYGSIAPEPDRYVIPGEAEDRVSQIITGLQPATTYHYALVATDVAGTVTGPEETFTTPSVPAPTVSTGSASEVSLSSASVSGQVNPMGWDTTYRFEYGRSTTYGSTWPTVPVDMGALTGPQPVLIVLQNLQPGTTYHYRLVASNPGGTGYGTDQSFTTGEYPVSVIQPNPVGGPLGIPPTAGKPTTTKPKPKSKKHKHPATKPKKSKPRKKK
jgi:hypothetical protein